jgi:peptide/nickel transport system substrate-binding protein
MANDRKLSRRELLGAGALGAAALGLAACGGSTGAPKSSGPGAKVAAGPPGPGPFSGGSYGGSVTTGWLDEANSYDPALGYNAQAWEAIACLLNTPLYMFGGSYGPAEPALAEGMPEISADRMRYIIRLRKGVRFSNGRPVVADDYIYSWTRVLDPKVASWASTYLYPIEGSDKVVSGKSKTVSGLRAIDDYTLEVRLSSPVYTFLNYLAQPFMAAVPEEAVESLGSRFGTNPVGTGPFMVQTYNTSDQNATFVRNPYYTWKGLPYLSGVKYTWGLNENLELLQLQQGSIDVIGDGIGSDVMGQVDTDRSLNSYVVDVKLNATSWVALNLAKAPLNNKLVRLALNWGTDREALARVTHGLYAASGYPLPSNLTAYHSITSPFGYDLAKAKSLLAEAGVSHFSLQFLTDGESPWEDIAELLQQQWQQLGITLNIDTVSESAWDTITTTLPLRTDAFQDIYEMVQPSALDLIIPCYTTGGGYNTVSYNSPQLDALVTKAQDQTSLAASNKYVAQIEQLLAEDAAAVFLFDVRFPVGRSPSLHNFQYQGYTGTRYERLWV